MITTSPRSRHTSARVRVPTTLARIVSTLCVSHQSTLGRPVTPAALNTCVGLTSAMSDSKEDRFSRRPDPYSNWIPWAVQSLPKSPPIHPVRPYIRNLRDFSSEPLDGNPMICGERKREREKSERNGNGGASARSVPLLSTLDPYCFAIFGLDRCFYI